MVGGSKGLKDREFQTDGPMSDKEQSLQTSSSSTDGVDVWSVVLRDSRTEFQTDGPVTDKERSLQTSASSTAHIRCVGGADKTLQRVCFVHQEDKVAFFILNQSAVASV